MATEASVTADFWVKALAAIANGEATAPLFKKAGISSISQLLASDPSFGIAPSMVSMEASAATSAALQRLQERMIGFNQGEPGACLQWPANPEGVEYLTLIVDKAKYLKASEMSAIGSLAAAKYKPAPAGEARGASEASSASDALHAESTKKLTARGKTFYEEARAMFPASVPDDVAKRVKYARVAETRDAYTTGIPVIFPLGEYGLELAVGSGKKKESYEHMGKTYVSSDPADKPVEIKDHTTFLRMVERRAATSLAALSFDYKADLVKRGRPWKSYPHALEDSEVSYIVREGADDPSPTVKTVNAYCTPDGAQREVDAMKAFLLRNPHAPIGKLLSVVDAGIQKSIAQFESTGYSKDAAIYQVCVKSPELYSAALVLDSGEGDATGSGAAPTKTEEPPQSGTGKRAGKRTASEQEAVFEKRLSQKDAQIENLKKGKGKGHGGKGGGGYGGGYGGGGWNDARGGGQWQQWAGGDGGKGGGKGGGWNDGGGGKGGGGKGGSGPYCPDYLCKAFNFSVGGCTHTNCTRQHICCVCGANHPFRGNH